MFNLAICYLKLECSDLSLSYFEQCQKLNNKNVEYVLGQAKVYQQKRQYRKAIEMYEEANKLLPDDPEMKSDDVSSFKTVSTS